MERVLSVKDSLKFDLPLHCFSDDLLAEEGHLQTLKAKHDIAKSLPRSSSMTFACSANRPTIVRYLHCQYSKASPRTRTLFAWKVQNGIRCACEAGRLEVVQELFNLGWALDADCRTDLLLSCGSRAFEFTQEFPDNEKVLKKATLRAIERSSSELLSLLLRNLSVPRSALVVVATWFGSEKTCQVVQDYLETTSSHVFLDTTEACLFCMQSSREEAQRLCQFASFSFAQSAPGYVAQTGGLPFLPLWKFVHYVWTHFDAAPEGFEYDDIAEDLVMEGNSEGLDFISKVADVDFAEILGTVGRPTRKIRDLLISRRIVDSDTFSYG